MPYATIEKGEFIFFLSMLERREQHGINKILFTLWFISFGESLFWFYVANFPHAFVNWYWLDVTTKAWRQRREARTSEWGYMWAWSKTCRTRGLTWKKKWEKMRSNHEEDGTMGSINTKSVSSLNEFAYHSITTSQELNVACLPSVSYLERHCPSSCHSITVNFVHKWFRESGSRCWISFKGSCKILQFPSGFLSASWISSMLSA